MFYNDFILSHITKSPAQPLNADGIDKLTKICQNIITNVDLMIPAISEQTKAYSIMKNTRTAWNNENELIQLSDDLTFIRSYCEAYCIRDDVRFGKFIIKPHPQDASLFAYLAMNTKRIFIDRNIIKGKTFNLNGINLDHVELSRLLKRRLVKTEYSHNYSEKVLQCKTAYTRIIIIIEELDSLFN